MNQAQAENAITLSALVTTGIFAYRKAVEPSVTPAAQLTLEGKGGQRAENLYHDYESIFGAKPPIEWGQFLKAAGLLYISLAIVGSFSPSIGGSGAVLVGVSALIGQGTAVLGDLKAEPGERSAAKVKALKTSEETFAKLRAKEATKLPKSLQSEYNTVTAEIARGQ